MQVNFVRPRTGRETSRNNANQREPVINQNGRPEAVPDVCAGQRFGVHRSGGPKVPSSNLGSPTNNVQVRWCFLRYRLACCSVEGLRVSTESGAGHITS